MSPEQAASAELTVERLLAEELLRGSLISGASGLDRVVTWCLPLSETTLEVDLAGDDLTGVAAHIPDNLLGGTDGGRLVERLSARGVSALLAWRGEGSDHADLTSAASVADSLALPLLRVRCEATYLRTSRLIATKVLAQSTHVLEYGHRVHRILGDVFARGGGLDALASKMSQLSGTTVLIINNTGEALATASPPSSPRATTEEMARLVQPAVESVNDSDPPADDEFPQITEVVADGEKAHVILAPVRVSGQPFGLLVLVEPSYPTSEHDLSQHAVMAKQGVSLTGSELLRQQSVREAEERARNDFVHALLHGRFSDQLELRARAEHYEFPLEGQFAVFIVAVEGLHPDEARSRRTLRHAARASRSISQEGGQFTLTALVGSMIVIVREMSARLPTGTDSPDAAAELRSFGEQLFLAMGSRFADDRVRVSYGRIHKGAPGVKTGYREARTTEALGRRVSTAPVSFYSDLRVFAALEASALSSAGKTFAADVLAPLQQADGQTGNLEEVVLAYIQESGNLNATARRLHLHRNTMLYKLDRASRALHMDIRSTEAQFTVWLAHHITALGEVVSALDQELSPPS